MITKVEINAIITQLYDVGDAYLQYTKDKRAVLETYRGHALEDEMKNAEIRARASAGTAIRVMGNQLDAMIKEAEKGNAYNVTDSSVSDAAKILANKGISLEAAQAVIKPFIGNMVALNLLRASAAEDIKPLFDYWLFDNVKALNRIRYTVGTLSWDSLEHYPAIVSSIREGIQDFAIHQGIEIGEMGGSIEELRMRNIQLLMGLDPDKL